MGSSQHQARIAMATTILLSAGLALQAVAKTVRSPTPPMGWNSYNTWNCLPSEEKIHESAHGLIDLGLSLSLIHI